MQSQRETGERWRTYAADDLYAPLSLFSQLACRTMLSACKQMKSVQIAREMREKVLRIVFYGELRASRTSSQFKRAKEVVNLKYFVYRALELRQIVGIVVRGSLIECGWYVARMWALSELWINLKQHTNT